MREVWDVDGIDLQPHRPDLVSSQVVGGRRLTRWPKNVEAHSDSVPSDRHQREVLCCAKPAPQFCLGA